MRDDLLDDLEPAARIIDRRPGTSSGMPQVARIRIEELHHVRPVDAGTGSAPGRPGGSEITQAVARPWAVSELNLALDAHALTDGEGDHVQDLGQVAADLALDVDGRDHQVEVIAVDAAQQWSRASSIVRPSCISWTTRRNSSQIGAGSSRLTASMACSVE